MIVCGEIGEDMVILILVEIKTTAYNNINNNKQMHPH